MLRRYLKESRKGVLVPRGLVVMEADPKGDGRVDLIVGWSLCNSKPDENNRKDTFNKKDAFKYATAADRLKVLNLLNLNEVQNYINNMPHSLKYTAADLYSKMLRYQLSRSLINVPANT